MIRRLLGNPAAVVLAAVVLLGLIALDWAMDIIVDQQAFGFSGTPTEEQVWQMRLMTMAQAVPPWATLTGVAALLGILVIGSASRRPEPRPASPASPEPSEPKQGDA